VIALLHNAQLHEHRPDPSPVTAIVTSKPSGPRSHPSSEANLSPIKRNRTGAAE
jgi:hypothetical protein